MYTCFIEKGLDDKDSYCIAEASTWIFLNCMMKANKPETILSACYKSEFIYSHNSDFCSGITHGRVLNGELYA